VWPIICIPIGVFNKGFFYFWVGLSAAWDLVATGYLCFAPLIEASDELLRVMKGMVGMDSSDVKDVEMYKADGTTSTAAPAHTAAIGH
jgi:urea-proton symporter